MTIETEDLINALNLNDKADNERLAMARSLALRHLNSRAPIPGTLMNILTEAENRVQE